MLLLFVNSFTNKTNLHLSFRNTRLIPIINIRYSNFTEKSVCVIEQ
jgi:hypothetical protein